MLDLFEESSPIDEIILGDKLNQKGILEDCGSYLYLIELLDSAPAQKILDIIVKCYTSILSPVNLSASLQKLQKKPALLIKMSPNY